MSFADWDPNRPWRRTVELEEFRAAQRAEAEADAAGAAVPAMVPVVPVDHETPPVPADLLVEPEGWLERVDAEIEAWLAVASPAERFATIGETYGAIGNLCISWRGATLPCATNRPLSAWLGQC